LAQESSVNGTCLEKLWNVLEGRVIDIMRQGFAQGRPPTMLADPGKYDPDR
jgi:hypothetical protein